MTNNETEFIFWAASSTRNFADIYYRSFLGSWWLILTSPFYFHFTSFFLFLYWFLNIQYTWKCIFSKFSFIFSGSVSSADFYETELAKLSCKILLPLFNKLVCITLKGSNHWKLKCQIESLAKLFFSIDHPFNGRVGAPFHTKQNVRILLFTIKTKLHCVKYHNLT